MMCCGSGIPHILNMVECYDVSATKLMIHKFVFIRSHWNQVTVSHETCDTQSTTYAEEYTPLTREGTTAQIGEFICIFAEQLSVADKIVACL